MYKLYSGLKVIPTEELKPNISKILLETFLETYRIDNKLEDRLEQHDRLYELL